MAVRGAVESRTHLSRREVPRLPMPAARLWPGILGSLRTMLATARARRELTGAIELAERGRATGARV